MSGRRSTAETVTVAEKEMLEAVLYLGVGGTHAPVAHLPPLNPRLTHAPPAPLKIFSRLGREKHCKCVAISPIESRTPLRVDLALNKGGSASNPQNFRLRRL